MKLHYQYTYFVYAIALFCSLPTIVAEYKPNYTDECSLCLIPLSSKAISELQCKHPFHTVCITPYKEAADKKRSNLPCPICRAEHQGPLVTITEDKKQDEAIEDLAMQRAIAASLESKAREDRNRQEINALNQQDDARKKAEQERIRLLNQRNLDAGIQASKEEQARVERLRNQEALDAQKAQLASHASEKERKEREKAQQAAKQSIIAAFLELFYGRP